MVESSDMSSKRLKFREIAEARTNRAIDAVSKIGNLSNKQLYEWEEAEVRKIIKALRDAVAEVEQRFTSPKMKRGGGFTL
jgi:hypothetical protein